MARPAAQTEVTSEDAIFELTLNVLGYREDREWTALALEMDLQGFGATFREAVQDLRDLVRMQVEFAHFKGQPEMLLRPAEPVWWQRYAEVRRDRLNSLILDESQADADFDIAGIKVPLSFADASFSPVDA